MGLEIFYSKFLKKIKKYDKIIYKDNMRQKGDIILDEKEKIELQPEDKVKVSGTLNTGMTVYDLSKQIVKNGMTPCVTSAELEPHKKLLRKFKKLGYYMLMCRERNYYTVIRVRKAKNPDTFEDLVIELLQDNGVIYNLEYNKDKTAIECWIKIEEEIYMFMLFPYSWGVLECA